jgi:N-acetylmuramic acid 6-phosphate (MurNAc-6-P) etherase
MISTREQRQAGLAVLALGVLALPCAAAAQRKVLGDTKAGPDNLAPGVTASSELKPATARKLTLKFLSSHGGANPGASEIGVFSEPLADLDAAEVHATAADIIRQASGKPSNNKIAP